MLMRVVMYSAARLYGFASPEGSEEEVFFHLESFHHGEFTTTEPGPPPIVGEMVEVEYIPGSGRGGGAPRASRVVRAEPPEALVGTVESFDERKGWGFIKADNGQDFYLHRSEVEGGRLPLPGRRVSFFRGFRQGRPRACHVRLET